MESIRVGVAMSYVQHRMKDTTIHVVHAANYGGWFDPIKQYHRLDQTLKDDIQYILYVFRDIFTGTTSMKNLTGTQSAAQQKV